MKALVIAGSIFGVLALAVMVLVGIVFSANNFGVKSEQNIIAAYDNNRNILSNYSKKVAEAVQIPAMYTEDLTKVVTATMEGRYGKNGSGATMQWLKEANVNFDPSLYKQVQQIIEAGRNDFQQGQQRLLDVKRQYQTELGVMPRGFILGFLGFPKIDLKKYDIVTDNRTETSFETKKEEAIQLRPNVKK